MTNEMLSEAKRLHDLSFAIIPLYPKSKRPKGLKWTSGPRFTWPQFLELYKDGDNIGVRLGEASKIGERYLACIDIDIKEKSFKVKAQKFLDTLKENTFPTVRSGSMNGSCHLYFISDEPFKMITILKEPDGEICIYSTGRQMVLPPSVHPNTGKNYKWVIEPDQFPVLNPKDFLKIEKNNVKNTKNEKVETPFNFSIEEVDLEWLPLSEKFFKGIKTGEGVEDRSAFLITACQALLSAGLNQNEILSVLTDEKNYLASCALERRGNRKSAAKWVYDYSLKKVLNEKVLDVKPVSEIEPDLVLDEAKAKAQNDEIKAEQDWRQELDKTQSKKAKCTLKNLNLILTNKVEGTLFVKDLFANRIFYGTNTPWGRDKNQFIEDIDILLIKHWLGQGEFNIEPTKDALHEVTALIAHHERIHPVRDWLNSLKWDGKSRVNTWLKDYCQAEAEEPYLSEVSRKFLIAMVKRVFEPGCQWDYTLVLEGEQGRYKSTIARTLASDKWFLDNLPDLRDKDAMLNLQGKWLIELGELTNVKRSDFNLVKQYLVRRIDTVRPHYGRIMADVPRQSVFIGTVNDGQYLKDPTGNRRFWPVKTGHCDVEGLKKVREQLFAEAYHVYKTDNEVLMLSPKATEQAVEAQEDRRIDDDEVMMREALQEFMTSSKAVDFDFTDFKTDDLLVFGMPWARWAKDKYIYQNASQVFKKLGFRPERDEKRRFWTNGKKA